MEEISANKIINSRGGELYSSMKQCSGIKNIPISVLKAAKAAGCSAFKANSRIDWAEFQEWYDKNKHNIQSEDDGNSYQKWNTRKKKADALKTELELDRLKGSYLTTEEAASKISSIAQSQRAMLKSLFTLELPHKLAGLTVPEISVILEKELNSVCDLMKNLKV